MRMRVMGGKKTCILKKKGVAIQGLVPPYGFGISDCGLLVCQLR